MYVACKEPARSVHNKNFKYYPQDFSEQKCTGIDQGEIKKEKKKNVEEKKNCCGNFLVP